MMTIFTAASIVSPVAHADGVSCQAYDVPVTLAVDPPAQTVYGELCVPQNGATTVFVLLHGTTYNHLYYDLPYQPESYSLADRLNRAGYATFNLDKVGAGNSSRPPSASVVTSVMADALHQVIQGLRAGAFNATTFSKVAFVGHSGGAIIGVIESLTYGDMDGLVLEGLAHILDPNETANFFNMMYPATQDPKFAGQPLDSGYVTTRPGTRDFFHSISEPVAELVAFDEANKDVYPLSPADDGLLQVVIQGRTRELTVPVLVGIGSEDRFYCTPLSMDCSSNEAVYAQEAEFYGPQAQLRTFLLPRAGHNLTMAHNTKRYQRAVVRWAHDFID